MAKDDYYTLVCKVLVYLYRRLKGKEKTDPVEYIAPLTNDFPVERDYLWYVIEQMEKQGFIENLLIHKAWGGDIVMMDWSRIRITPAGIDYLRDNNTMKKIAGLLPEARAIWELFS